MRFRAYNLTFQFFHNTFKENLSASRLYYSSKVYKVLFLGSDNIALSSLRKINEFKKNENIIEPLDIVTANNAKHQTIIEKYAQAENIQTLKWPLKGLQPGEYDIGLIVAFGHLITKDVLEKFPLGMVNVHPSLLPRWRGAAPIIHTLMHGDKITGVSLMRIKADKFDVGEIISQVQVPVPDHITQPELTEQLSEIGADMLVRCMRSLPESLANARPQGEQGVTYAKKIHKSISEVRWSEMTTQQVYNLYRALHGIYPLSTKFRDKQIKLFDPYLDLSEVDTNENLKVGSLEYCDKRSSIKVLCADKKYIYFKSMRIVGRRKISALDFYNGYIKNLPADKRSCFVLCS